MKNLTIQNVSKTYFDPYAGANVTAVHDISLKVNQGEFISIVGPSGCGKTTLLNMIAGFLPISGGSINIDDKPIKGPGADRGVVFQTFALFPWKTVGENVGFGPRMRGLPKKECDQIALEFLSLVGLEHVPDVLLMDEPFASVDAQTRMTLQEELTKIWQARRPTILFITHDVPESVFLADRVVVLSKGRVLEDMPIQLQRPRVWDQLIEDDTFKGLSAQVLSKVRSA